MCGVGLLFSLVAAFAITRNISGAITQLKYATAKISEGEFDYRPQIRNKDELGDLAQEFVVMAERLKRLEEMNLDSSPLTRLPGGVAIENMLNRRISLGVPLAFCLIDIDNFKAYNDRYGYARGNDSGECLFQGNFAVKTGHFRKSGVPPGRQSTPENRLPLHRS